MRKQFSLTPLLCAILAFFAGASAHAQSAYSNAIVNLVPPPAAYWPLQESAQPVSYIATNLGSIGSAGNGYYMSWFSNNVNNLFLTNTINHGAGAIVADADTAMLSTGLSGQYVGFPQTDPRLSIKPPFTLEAWVKTTATNSLTTILSQGRATDIGSAPGYQDVSSGFWLGQNAGAYIITLYNQNGTFGQEIDVTNATLQGVWAHLAVTFDGTNLAFYVNGATPAPIFSTATGRILANPASPGTIGFEANSAGHYFEPNTQDPLIIGAFNANASIFNGGIDEVAVYPAALSSAQILAHYQNGINASPAIPYKQLITGDAPSLYLRLDEPAMNTVLGVANGTSISNYPALPVANNYGSIGAGANGVYAPGTTPGVAGPSFSGFGAYTNAVAINGWNGFVDVGIGNITNAARPMVPALLSNKQPISVISWFKANPADGRTKFQSLLSRGNSAWRMALDNNDLNRFNPGSGNENQYNNGTTASFARQFAATNGFYLNDGNWHMEAGVADGTNVLMYLDGRLALTTNMNTFSADGGRDLLIGADPDNINPGGRSFAGSIAHVAYFTNALSAATIQSLYTTAAVPPFIATQPQSLGTFAGYNGVLRGLAGGSPSLVYAWYKGTPGSASALSDAGNITGSATTNLNFTSLVATNAGSYFLVVTNSAGSVTSSVVSLTVSSLPTNSYATTIRSLNPVGYWPLTETNLPPAPPYAANLGSLGAALNGIYGTWWQPNGNYYVPLNFIAHVPGHTGDGDTAAVFGSSGQYVVLPHNNPASVITAPFTVEAWVFPTNAFSGSGGIISQARNNILGANIYKGFYLGSSNGNNAVFALYNTNGQVSQEIDITNALPQNTWTHIVGTFDGTSASLYINGVLSVPIVGANPKALTLNGAGQAFVPDDNSPLIIGCLGTFNSGRFPGYIDEVAIYPTALSQAQIQANFAAVSGTQYQTTVLSSSPSIYLRLDDATYVPPAASTFPVAVNYGNVGSVANGLYQPGTVPGVSGPPFTGFGTNNFGVAFNGIGPAVDIGGGNLAANMPILNPTGTNNITVVAWFKGAQDAGRTQNILSHSGTGWRMGFNNSGAPSFNPGSSSDITATNALSNDGNWHMLAGVFTGARNLLYIDGVLNNSAANSANNTGSILDLLIGGAPDFTAPQSRTYEGSVSQVAFFTNALTASQVALVYYSGNLSPVSITQQPTPASVSGYAGVNATVSLLAAGTAPVYQWSLNGTNIVGATNASYSFTLATTNAGTLACVVSNAYGAPVTSSGVTVTIIPVPANPYSAAILADSPLGYWRLDETSGTVANDYVHGLNGKYNSVTLGVTPGYSPNDPDAAAGFGPLFGQPATDSVVSDIPVDFSTTAVGSSTINFSVEAWVKGPAQTTDAGIVTRGGPTEQFNLDCGGASPNHAFRFFVRSIGGGGPFIAAGAGSLDNNWHYLVGVCDEANGAVKLYVDGALISTATISTTAGIYTGGPPMSIGARVGAGTNYNNQFNGIVDEVAVYSYALTPAKIQAHFNAAPFPPSITQQPTNGTFGVGTTASTFVGVKGTPPLTYTWINADTLATIPGQTNALFSINNAQISNSGNYQAIVSNAYGSVTSSVAAITVVGPPVFVSAVQPVTRYVGGAPATFSVIASGSLPLSYQWKIGTNPVPGATNTTFTTASPTAQFSDAGNYTCVVTNAFGTNSSTAAFTVLALPTNGYNAVVLADVPVAYWRLDETNGAALAHDLWGGLDGTYTNTTLGIAGFSPLDPDTAALFGPSNSFVGNIPLNFASNVASNGNAAFTVEAWINGTSEQLYDAGIVTVGYGSGGEQFLMDTGNVIGTNHMVRWIVRNAAGAGSTINTSFHPVDGKWHQLVGVCNETNSQLVFYIDGVSVGTAFLSANSGLLPATTPLSIGSRKSGNNPIYDFQLNASVDEVSVYNKVLTAAQVLAHYNAVPFPPVIAQQPQSQLHYPGTPANFSVTLASGSPPFSYQWSSNGLAITGATNSTLTVASPPNGSSYAVAVSNPYVTTNSASATVTFVTAPNTPFPAQVLADHAIAFWRLDETSGSVAYDYVGGFNGTYTNVLQGVSQGYSFNTDPSELAPGFGPYYGIPSDSYVGNIPINFSKPNGSNAEFSVEAWINVQGLPETSDGGVVTLGYGAGGEEFSLDTGAPGHAFRFIMRNAAGVQGTVNSSFIPYDSIWHHLVAVCDQANNALHLYVDGQDVADSTAAGAATGILSPTTLVPLSIGARKAGVNTTYTSQFSGSINQVAIYNYALSPGQVQSHYFSVGVAPVFTHPITNTTLNASQGSTVTLSDPAFGTPPLAYQWYYDTSFANGGTIIPGATNATLVITNVQPGNAGGYWVQVTNAYGTVSDPAGDVTLNVIAGPPSIQQDLSPASITLYTGAHITYSIVVGGTVPFRYQWFHNGSPVPGQTNASYNVGPLTTNSAGTYTVTVTNSQGSLTSPASVVSLGVVPAPTAIYPQAVLSDSPVGYWRLDETNGATVANDYVGGHNGTYNTDQFGAPLEVQGVQGYNPTFDADLAATFGTLATSNSYVGNINGIDFSQQGSNVQFSVEAWVNANAQAKDNGIVAMGYGVGGEQFDLDAFGGFRFFARDAVAQGAHQVNGTISPNGQWHHLVGVFDEANGKVLLYVDGVTNGVSAAGGPPTPGTGLEAPTTPMSIGARRSGLNVPDYDNQFVGTVDEVAVYDHALSPAQVHAHYVAGTSPQVTIIIQPVGNQVQLLWSFGTLQSSSTVDGTYTTVIGATSPYSINPVGAQKFFRVKLN